MEICVMASLGRNGKAQAMTYRTPNTGNPEGRVPHE